MPEPTTWDCFAHDPRREENARLRASDRDRDVVNDVLSTAYAEGRLSPEELDERSDRTAASKTLGELPGIVDDLVSVSTARTVGPHDLRAEAERRYRDQRRQALFQFLTPTLICWVVWVSVLIGGHGTAFPWPAFVMIGTGMRFVQLATNREDTIVAIEKNLDKKKKRTSLEAGRRDELGSRSDHDDEPSSD